VLRPSLLVLVIWSRALTVFWLVGLPGPMPSPPKKAPEVWLPFGSYAQPCGKKTLRLTSWSAPL